MQKDEIEKEIRKEPEIEGRNPIHDLDQKENRQVQNQNL